MCGRDTPRSPAGRASMMLFYDFIVSHKPTHSTESDWQSAGEVRVESETDVLIQPIKMTHSIKINYHNSLVRSKLSAQRTYDNCNLDFAQCGTLRTSHVDQILPECVGVCSQDLDQLISRGILMFENDSRVA